MLPNTANLHEKFKKKILRKPKVVEHNDLGSPGVKEMLTRFEILLIVVQIITHAFDVALKIYRMLHDDLDFWDIDASLIEIFSIVVL